MPNSVVDYATETLRQGAVNAAKLILTKQRMDLQRIVERAAELYATPIAAISIIDRGRQILLSRIGVDMTEMPRAASLCATAIHSPGEALIVPDAVKDRRFAELPLVREAPHIRFYAGMPIVNQQGYALGALCVIDSKPRHGQFDPFQLVLLTREVERLLSR